MRILHVINNLQLGGAENLVVQMLPLMREKNIDVEVALFVDHNTLLKQQLENKGIRIHSFSAKGSSYNPLHIIRLRNLIKNFDIIHTHNTSPQLFARIANIGKKKILFTTEHGGSNRRRAWKWYAPVDRWMYRGYDRIICISEKAEDNLRSFIGSSSEKITTIQNGIDVKRFANAQPSRLLEEIAPNSRKLIMVAGFRWEKDQPTVIKSLNYLSDSYHIFLVGDGVRREEFETLVRDQELIKRVHFLGIRNDIPELLKSSDFIIMSSHFEGLSLSSIEGMAAGKPMIASDVDGLREVVGNVGILFEHENPEDLAQQILKLDSSEENYQDIAKRCSLESSKYDVHNTVKEYISYYQTI